MIPIVIVGSALDFERYWHSPMEQWKLVFSREVLPKIEKGVRKVGIDEDGSFCPNCYAYGDYTLCDETDHTEYVYVNWEQFRKNSNSWMFRVCKDIDILTYFRIDGNTLRALCEHASVVKAVIMWNQKGIGHELPASFGLTLAKNA